MDGFGPCSPWKTESHGFASEAHLVGNFGMSEMRVFEDVSTMEAKHLGHLLPGDYCFVCGVPCHATLKLCNLNFFLSNLLSGIYFSFF
jgi:hypothetical protein